MKIWLMKAHCAEDSAVYEPQLLFQMLWLGAYDDDIGSIRVAVPFSLCSTAIICDISGQD